MFKKIFSILTLAVAATTAALVWAGSAPTNPGETVAIPTAPGEYISWNYATLSSGKISCENDAGTELGSCRNGNTAVFNLESTETTAYTLNFSTCTTNDNSYVTVTIENEAGMPVFTQESVQLQNRDGKNWHSFPDAYQFDVPELPAGKYTLTFSFSSGSSYAGNMSQFALYKRNGGNDPVEPVGPKEDEVEPLDSWMNVPGQLPLGKWIIDNTFRHESSDAADGGNFGYTEPGAKAHFNMHVTKAGVYNWKWNIPWKQNDGEFTITVLDQATGIVEAKTIWNWINSQDLGDYDFNLNGYLTTGKKTVTVECTGGARFVCNFKTPTLTWAGNAYAALTGVTIEGQTNSAFEGYDYNFNLPKEFTAETLPVNVTYNGGTLSAKLGDQDITAASDAEGKAVFNIAAPKANEEAVLTFTITPAEGAAYDKLTYSVRIFHIGGTIVSTAKVDGVELPAEAIEALNADKAYTLAGNIYTAVPEVEFGFVDGTSAKGTATVAGTTAAVKVVGGKDADAVEYALNVEGIHQYTPAATDLHQEIRWDRDWGLFTLTPMPGDGWSGTQIKFSSNTDYTLNVPSNATVKQIVFWQMGSNYGNPGALENIASEGANVYKPTNSEFRSGYRDLTVNVENHQTGAPFTFRFKDGNQPCSGFDIYYTEAALTTAPAVLETTQTSTENLNHAVVSMKFDREMKDVKATVNGKEVKAKGGSNILNFALWNLNWNSDNLLTIAAGAAKDTYGNANAEAITYTVKVGNPAAVEAIAAENFIVVSNADELKAAVASVNETNKSADAPHVVIYLKNGDYCVGTEKISGHHLHINRAHNVSLIGESRDGVLIHGVNDGISNAVLSTRYSTNIYIENLTVRNDLDYNAVVAGGKRVGVGAAFYGGNRDIMKNVTLQSIQDTYVTGEQGYHVDCQIEGGVDYICGGGDHVFQNCTIRHIGEGGYITAPSTSPKNQWGYVFLDCTIKGDSNYCLGRPWQNEPRAYFINTTMEAKAAAKGWNGMSTLPTHFYEYNSMDKNGNAIDLSGRKNAETSTNEYTPVLTAEEAAEFTVENILGGSDSWYAPEMTETLAATTDFTSANGTLLWKAVERAAGYIVYEDNVFAGYTATAEFALPAEATQAAAAKTYTVRAINANGAQGTVSSAYTDGGVGVDGIDAEAAEAEYFNLQGVRVSGNAAGAVIEVRNGKAVKKMNR